MAQIDGDLAVLDTPFPYTVYNKFLTNWRDAAAPTGALPGLIWSDSGDNRLYHTIAAATFYQIAQGEIMPVADGVRLTEPGGADYMDLLLDGTDAFIKWSDGGLILQTYEADSSTLVHLKPTGTSEYSGLFLWDKDDWRLQLFTIADEGIISSNAGDLHFQYDIAQDIKCWSAIAAGNPYFYIYGYGTAAVEWLRMRVEADNDALIEAEHNLNLTAVAGGHISIPSNFLNFGSASVGIVGGAITATCGWMKVTAEEATPDILTTINGGAEGDILILTNEGPTHNVTVDDAADNIQTDGDFVLWAVEASNITLMKIGATWYEISRHRQ